MRQNRLTEIIDANDTPVAEVAYDALGRRIEKYDAVADETVRYYYSKDWQVLCEKDDNEDTQRWFVYGGYIDEVLIMIDADADQYYYAHDHLYSPVALLDPTGTVLERYEYDAYGKDTIWDSTFTNQRTISNYDNPFGLTGCRLDVLDNSSRSLSYLRNRYLDCPIGRWLTPDPLGITPYGSLGNQEFKPREQYLDGLNLYEYVKSNPVIFFDSKGLSLEITTYVAVQHYLYRKGCGVIAKQRNINLEQDQFGHRWLEGCGGTMGWWPKKAVDNMDLIKGTPGVLQSPDPHWDDSGWDWMWYTSIKENGVLSYGPKAGTQCKCIENCQDICGCLHAIRMRVYGTWGLGISAKDVGSGTCFRGTCWDFVGWALSSCCLEAQKPIRNPLKK